MTDATKRLWIDVLWRATQGPFLSTDIPGEPVEVNKLIEKLDALGLITVRREPATLDDSLGMHYTILSLTYRGKTRLEKEVL